MYLEKNYNCIFSRSYFPWYNFLPKTWKLNHVVSLHCLFLFLFLSYRLQIYQHLSLSVFIVTPSVLIPLCHSQVLYSFSLPLGLYLRDTYVYILPILIPNSSDAEFSGNSVCTICRYLNFFSMVTSTSTSCSHFSHDPFFSLCSAYT